MTQYGTKWGSQRDLGYSSAEEPIAIHTDFDRPPHRTQPISPGRSPALNRRIIDTTYDPSYLNRGEIFRSAVYFINNATTTTADAIPEMERAAIGHL